LRDRISERLAAALVARGSNEVTLALLRRPDVPLGADLLSALAHGVGGTDATIRGALLDRADLPAAARYHLIEIVVSALRGLRVVRGAVAPARLDRLLRDATDTALTAIGEREAGEGRAPYVAEMVASERVSARLMLHAIDNGH